MFSPLVGLILLDADGGRLAVKYNVSPGVNLDGKNYASPTTKACSKEQNTSLMQASNLILDFNGQRSLEMQLIQKFSKIAARNEVETFEVGEYIALSRSQGDVFVFIVANSQANEILLLEVMNSIVIVLNNITGNQVGKRQILDNLGSVFLMFDEIVDNGMLLEIDPAIITARISMQDVSDTPSGEQTAFNQAITSAKENIMRSLLSGAS